MAAKDTGSSPLTFDLRRDLLDKIEDYQRKSGVRSKSEVIRDAIQSYNYAGYQRRAQPHRQISVRLPVDQKRELLKLARQKKVSLGELLRAALESLPETPVRAAGENNKNPGNTVTKAKAKKPAAKKAAPRKAAKPAGKKPAAKKAGSTSVAKKAPAKKAGAAKAGAKKPAAKKAPATKAAAKKAPAKKAPAKKAPARKAVAKKAAAPKATAKAPAKKKAPARKAGAKKK